MEDVNNSAVYVWGLKKYTCKFFFKIKPDFNKVCGFTLIAGFYLHKYLNAILIITFSVNIQAYIFFP